MVAHISGSLIGNVSNELNHNGGTYQWQPYQ